MTDELLKSAVAGLLGVLNFQTADAAHQIDAVAEAFRQMHQQGGGTRIVRFTLGCNAGNPPKAHDPAIVEEVVSTVNRRRAG